MPLFLFMGVRDHADLTLFFIADSCADQLQIQAQLPLTLIPIRIDLEVPAHLSDY